MDAVLYLTVVCFIFEFVSLFMGFSLFMPVLNTTYIFSHFTGGVLLCWFIIDVWHYQTLWVLWIFFSVLPTMLEFGVVGMRICPCCKTNEY